MLIKDLKDDWPLIHEAALVRLKEVGKKYHSNLSIMTAFNWSTTTQGEFFWQKVNRSNFEEALKLCPHLDHRTKSVYNFKVGDKVKIPTVETTSGGMTLTRHCSAVSDASEKRQDFLYVTEIRDSDIVIGVEKHRKSSSFYPKDLELYEESSKIDLRNTKIYLPTEEDNLAFQRFAVKNGAKYSRTTDENFYKTAGYLFLDEDKSFGYMKKDQQGKDFFQIDERKEVFLKDLIPGYKSKAKNVFIWDKADFKDTTITLENEDQVRIFQEYVFSKGIKWYKGHDGKVKYLNKRNFCIEDGYLLVTSSLPSNRKKITLDECISDWRDLIKYKKEQEIEPWAVGTYVVFIQHYGNSKKGNIDTIVLNDPKSNLIRCVKEGITTIDPLYTKWFATKEEAEKFSKELLNEGKWGVLIDDCSVGLTGISKYSKGYVFRITDEVNDWYHLVSDIKFSKKSVIKFATQSAAVEYSLGLREDSKWKVTDYEKTLVTGTPGNVEINDSTIAFRKYMDRRITNGYWSEPDVKVWNPYMTSGIGNHSFMGMGTSNHLDAINKVKKPSLELVKKKKKLLGTVVSTNNINLK